MKMEYCMKCMLPIHGAETCPHCGYEQEEGALPHQLPPGTILNGRFLIGRVIGQGGFGITYVGRDLKLDIKVAVKEYYPRGYASRNCQDSSEITITDKAQKDFIETGKKKFSNEARALGHFDEQPGIVKVRDFFEANQTAYIVMEYLDGMDLRTVLSQSLFQADEIFALMRPVMEALEKIHKEDVIHRDISPDNIMRLKNGTVKLMDFGAARILDYTDEKSRSVVLKAGYAPEEQYRPKGIQGPWSDIYALCATIYKCITGITPDDALQRCYEDELKWPSELGFPITALQESVLKKGMEVKQQDRFQNVREMMDMLDGKLANSKIHSIELSTDDEDGDTVYWERDSEKNDLPEESDEKAEDKLEDERDKKPDDEQKKTVIKGAWIAGVVAVLLLGGIFWGIRQNGASAEASNRGESTLETSPYRGGQSEDQTSDEKGQMRNIILTAHEDMSVKEFNAAVKILTERLQILTGGEHFELDVQEDKLKLSIPEEAFAGLDVTKVLQCYLSRSTALYLFNREQNTEQVEISRDDLESVTQMYGTLEGVDASQYGITTEEYAYLTVVLTENCAEKYQEEITAWGELLAFGQDMSQNSFWYHHTIPAGDGRTFYLINTDTVGNIQELLYYNLTHDPISHGFYYNIDLTNEAKWEAADETAANLCAPQEVSGNVVTIQYNCYREELSDGEWLDIRNSLKERLNTLEQPFAVGVMEKEGTSSIVVKTGFEHMGIPIMKLIGGTSSIMLRKGLRNAYFSSYDQLSLEQKEDGTWQVVIQFDDYNLEAIKSMLENPSEAGLYLIVNNMPYMTAPSGQQLNDGKVIFDRMCFWENDLITDERAWMLHLLETCVSGIEMPCLFSPANWWSEFEDKAEEQVFFPVHYNETLNQITDQLQAIHEPAKVSTNDTDGLNIYLHLDVDETLPEKAMSLVKDIYEVAGFENSVYGSITFYLIDEKREERARIYFYKSFSSSEEGYIYGGCRITGGRMDRYKENMKAIIDSDPFYQEMNNEYYSFE